MFTIPRTKLTRTIFFVVSDIILVWVSFFLAFALRFDAQLSSEYLSLVFEISGLALIFILPIFYFKNLYSFSWSYVSSGELVSLFFANTIAFIFLTLTIFISNRFPYFENFPRSVLCISYFLVFLFCGGVRMAKRIYFYASGYPADVTKENTLIIGAGDAGEQIVRSLISVKNREYRAIGLVDDSPIKQGVTIHGLKVLGKVLDIPEIAKKYQVSQIIVALPSAGSATIKQAVELARNAGIAKIKITPPLREVINQEISFQQLKDVEVGDLLGRDVVDIDMQEIKSFIANKVVLVTGAGGSIGSELSRQVAKLSPTSLVLFDQDETAIFNIAKELEEKYPSISLISWIGDVVDRHTIEILFKQVKPQIVFHAAAYKHVPLMEGNPYQAVRNNIIGTKVLAETSVVNGVDAFVFVSTDKAVNPSSVMGATKRVGEMICQTLNLKESVKFMSVRFGNVLGSRGSVVPVFREQIKNRRAISITHPDMERYFMLIPEACLLILQASAMGKGGEVFVLDMGKPVKILDLAKEMIRLSGLEPDRDIPIVFTKPRPGEKLFEEILTSEEGTMVTKNKKIFTAKLSSVDGNEFLDNIQLLENMLEVGSTEALIAQLKKIIPSYK